MNDFRSIGVPAEGGGSEIGRKALWVVRELGLPAIVKACVSCRSTRHHPTGKFRVNANGKLLDVWMLICCELCGRTSKISIHERIHVQALESVRLLMFENNDPAMVRDLAMDGALAGQAAYRLGWSAAWELETGMPSGELERADPAPLKVTIRFELPAPIRVEKLLTAGFGLSRSAVRGMVDSGRIRLPLAIDAKAREDFTFLRHAGAGTVWGMTAQDSAGGHLAPGVRAVLAARPALLEDACQRALAYLGTLPNRRVAPAEEAVAALSRLDFALPGPGLAAPDVLAMLDSFGSPATVASGGPRYFGFVTGGALPVAQAAAWLSVAWDQNAALKVMSPAATLLDAVALRWVGELLGLPAGTGACFVTGATMANATCLAAARDAVLTRHGWDAAGQGLVGAPPVTVVVGAEVHTTVRKALGLVGLGRDRATVLPVDRQGRIDPRTLPALAGPALVCLQAGNVNSGASDSFVPLISWARDHGAWVHVDGAFGLWAAAAPATAEQVTGFAEADSWATDAHKWLNTTYDCGIALVRHPADLQSAMAAPAAYLPSDAGPEPMHFSPQSSQRARGVEVWAVLATLGRDGVAQLVDSTCRLARRFADGIRETGYDVLNDVVLNQVVVDFGDPARTEAVIAAIQQEGTCWCGPTTWRGRKAMRISVSSWNTTEDDIDQSIAAIRASAESVRTAGRPIGRR